MARVTGNAPWYEKSGMTLVKRDDKFDHALGAAFLIPLSFNFPVGNYTTKYIRWNWSSISFPIDGKSVSWSPNNEAGYTNLTYTLSPPVDYGYRYEDVWFENTSTYVRIRVAYHTNSSNSGQVEYIFFSNGNIQIKYNNPSSSSYDDDDSGVYYTYLRYEDWTLGNDKRTFHYLVADTTKPDVEGTIFIQRNSATSYSVYHNSYWENDSTYTIPLKSRILGEILINDTVEDTASWDTDSSDGTTRGVRGGTWLIPIYSPSAYNEPFRVGLPDGSAGCVRTQAPVAVDVVNPPVYVSLDGTKKQLSPSFNATKQRILQLSTIATRGNCSNNLTPPVNNGRYWINPSYRRGDVAVSGVYQIAVRVAVNTSKTDSTSRVYVYYSPSIAEGQSSGNFTYLGYVDTTGVSDAYTTAIFNVSNVTVGSVMAVSGINNNSYGVGGFQFAWNVYLGVNNGLKLL